MGSSAATAIAVVAIAGRFPGAESPEELFANLCAKRHGVTFFGQEALDPSVPDQERRDPAYVAARGVLASHDRFDASFFGMTASEAEVVDPQHRLLLELAWEVLERCAHRPSDFGGRIGVFVGAQWSTYARHNLQTRGEVVDRLGEQGMAMATEPEFVATRIGYELGLKGPCISIGTACSTSLVAVTQAVQALRAGDCALALAGGASIRVPVHAGHVHQAGGMLSADGFCRPFDERATGTTFSDGAALVALRRLEDAVADRDPILAVIRGVAVNNDGDDKVSYSAPSLRGQEAVLRAALADAGIEAASIGYIETHGTATPMGDPIELAALARVYGQPVEEVGSCALGAVKSAVGHLVHAAGVAGLAVAVLALRERILPPILHFETPNRRLGIERTRFVIGTTSRPWLAGRGPRRAAVSSFGVGGTNAHVVLEEAPVVATPADVDGGAWLRLSARSPEALQRRLEDLAGYLRGSLGRIRLSDVAHTLAVGREPMRCRAALFATSPAEAAAGLLDASRVRRGTATSQVRIVCQFPGHGAQRPGMARHLHATFVSSREVVERGIRAAALATGVDIRPYLLDGASDSSEDPTIAHPALLVAEVALSAALEECGLVADAWLGCSLGEFAAGVAAGVLDLEAAVALVARGAQRLADAEPGAMCIAYCTPAEAAGRLGPEVALAAQYTDEALALSGTVAGVASAVQRLAAAGIRSQPLRADRPYHTPRLQDVAAALEAELAAVPLRVPSGELYSCAVGGVLEPEQARSPAHWARILTAPVAYAAAVRAAGDEGRVVFVECGPGVGLTAAAMQLVGEEPVPPVAAMPGGGIDEATGQELLAAVAHCWVHGADRAARPPSAAGLSRLQLPPYPFERTRHWIEPGLATPAPRPAAGEPAAESTSLRPRLEAAVRRATGVSVDLDERTAWSALGLDSLTLTQLATAIRREFRIPIGLRELATGCGSPQLLLEWIRAQVPPSTATPSAATGSVATGPDASSPAGGATQRPNPGARIERKVGDRHRTTPEQDRFLSDLAVRCATRFARSRAFVAKHRGHLADPRTVSGFHPKWKDTVFPIVTDRSAGARLWDVDGNEFVDLLNGFGSILFGHSPDFLVEAIEAQLRKGVEIGPQTPLAGEVAELFCRLTGKARVGFTNTGSEAVMGALRVARTVTGRDKVVMFDGAYHGIFDEALARSDGQGGSRPSSPGVPLAHVGDAIVLPYAKEESLAVIERLGDSLAAVLVEPIQGRNPDVQPGEFLRSLRALTARTGTALVFDEVVTGFRAHPAGVQGLYGIEADLATYGKVVAGGHPIGLLAGRPEFMDALDGGPWSFGDASVPEAPVTFFAGTFVRHPLALAAARATLGRIGACSPTLQHELTATTQGLVARLRETVRGSGAGLRVATAHSTFFLSATPEEPWGSLLFTLLRLRGFHVWEQFPSFVTASHTKADLDAFVAAFAESIVELQQVGLLRQDVAPATSGAASPIPAGARLGRRADGSLAWFVPDPDRPGRYREVAEAGPS